jgi:hypothetical protein
METPLTIDDVELSCFLHQGIIIERKITCNSAFMLENPPLISTKMHQKLHWIPPE